MDFTAGFVDGTPSVISLASSFPADNGHETYLTVSSGTLPFGITLDTVGKRLIYDGTAGSASANISLTAKQGAPKVSFSNATGAIPVMFGIVFPKGAVTNDLGASDSGLRVVTRRRWNDNSIKHAVVCGVADSAGTVTFNTSPILGTALTAANIAAAAPTATVDLGSYGTASLASLLATPFETWISTEKMVECHYRWTSSVNSEIAVEFQVRLWADGKMWVRACVEYSKRIRTVTYNLPITGSVVIFGTTVQTYSATNLYACTQHIFERWYGATQYDVVVVQDTTQIMQTKLVPNYGMTGTVSEVTLANLQSGYTPNANLMFTQSMGAGGYQDQIGPLAHWDACYLISGDARAYRSVLAHGKACFSYPILWRVSGRNLIPTDYPNDNYLGTNQGGTNTFTAGSLTWETAHQPSMGYLAYLLTGDALFEDALLGQVAANFQANASDPGVNRVAYWEQTRQQAWTMRAIAQAAAMVHDGAAELSATKSWLDAQVNFYASISFEEPLAVNSALGYPLVVSTYNPAAPQSIAPWMHNFWIGTIGYASDIDPVNSSGMTKLINLRNWMYRGIVGLLGDGTTGNFCYQYFTDYNIVVSSEIVPSYTVRLAKDIYQSWGDVMIATHGSVSCGSTSSWPAEEFYSDGGMAMPAIAYAVDHAASGMDAAYARLTSSSGWPAYQASAWDQKPVWSVSPRIPAQTTTQGVTVTIAAQTGRPAWRTAMAPGTWAVVPGNRLDDIDPRHNALINPNYPGSAPWTAVGGQNAITYAWCGACWDEDTATFWMPLQGGHNDYFGNEPYKNVLWDDTPNWVMLRNPTGAIGNTGGVFNDGLEYTGRNWDGRFRSCHSYHKPVYVPGVGPMMAVLGSTSPNPNGTKETLLLNETSGEMTAVATWPGTWITAAYCYDQTRHRIWAIGGSDGKMSYLDCATMTWTILYDSSSNNNWEIISAVYIPGKDVLLSIAGSYSFSAFHVYNTAGIRYTPGTTGTGAAALMGTGGAKWSAELGCVLYWHNFSDPTLITTITPPANPLTEPWVLGVLPVDPSNSVIPSTAQGNGTYGRFQVSEKLGAAILLNSTYEPMFAFALDSGDPLTEGENNMATYTELYDADFSALDKQILVGITIKANIIAKLPTPNAAQRVFAVAALRDPISYLKTVRNYVVSDNNTATVAQILAATDAVVQTSVNAAVDTLLGV